MRSHTLDWENPYPSTRTAMFGANAVATSQPLAAQAGIRMLLRGGNAVDAAIATAIALTVVEPTMNGIGSDSFALVWDGKRLHALNASGRSPQAWNLGLFSGLSAMPSLGWGSVTVPGAVSSWITLSRTFGVLPFAELFQPAVEYAREGFIVTPYIARNWSRAAAKYCSFNSFAEMFLPGGRAPAVGQVFRPVEQAETLTEIAESFGESFYRGRLARLIVEHAHATGGLLNEDDLASHSVDWVAPVSVTFGEHTLHEIPPNSQGIAALLALELLQNTGVEDMNPDAAESLDLQLRAMHIAHSNIRARVADPDCMEDSAGSLLSAEHVDNLRLQMRQWDGLPTSNLRESGGDTVYLTAADASGMMVSFIQSNYFDFGSGIVIPGTGISLQSRGACFSLDARHPNVVAGGKRSFHTLAPAFVTSHDRPFMSFGVMGGPMQPQGHLQTFLRVCTQGQNPQAACDASRWYVTPGGDVLLEQGFASTVIDELRQRGYRVQYADYGDPVFGGGQFLVSLPGGYSAASDPRRDGQAAVL